MGGKIRGKVLAPVVASLLAAEFGASGAPTVAARPLGSLSIRVDGSIDEPAWSGALWTAGFRQSVPAFGEPATEQTSVAVLFDDHAIYVAVRCDDTSPRLIRANKLRHRDNPADDDHVEVVFDTYRDQTRGAVFVVNPLGAKEEGLVNGHQRYTWNWDEVWDVKARITASGWQAEFQVPLRVLRYRAAPIQEWGFNVKRVVRRLQEESYLAPPPPPYDISSLNYAATLAGLHLGTRQRNLQVIPYALGGLAQETKAETGDAEDRSLSEFGMDIKYSLSSDLTLDATYNTDFAEVESDDEQVNLTRFSLFYPEKREFFLENADLFSFGHFGGGPRYPDVAPFFSRRIGLYGGATVPLDGGLRLTGKVGREDVGVLSVRTAAVDELGVEDAWYNVARVRHDLGNRSYIGGIVTDSRRGDFSSTTTGVDLMWFLTSDLSLRADLLCVADSESDEPAGAANVNLDFTTDPWGFLFGCSQVDEGFSPDLGFVRRAGYRNKEALLRYSFRPGRWGVRRVSLRTINNWWDSLQHGVLESSSNTLNCDVELENGDFIELSTGRSFERLFEPFELDDEVVFAPGDYKFGSTTIEYHADESRRWGLDAEAAAGDFYDGERAQLGAEAWVVFNRHLRAEGSYSTVDVETRHGSLEWHLWGVRLSYAHSSTLSTSAFAQYNSSTGVKVLNLRLRWILPHDSDLYLVYNDRRDSNDGAPLPRVREVALKVSYRFFV